MGNGAAAGVAYRVQTASADDLRSAIAGLDVEEKTKLRTALNAQGATKLFDDLDDYCAFIYAFFPGTCY